MTTLKRDAVPTGDDIESVGESRVDVETGYEEEEEEEEEEKNPQNQKVPRLKRT